MALRDAPLWLATGLLSLCVLLGGSSQARGGLDWIVQLSSLAVLSASLAIPAAPSARGTGPALSLVAGAGLLVLAQLVPLPPAWWSALPGRGPFAQTYVDAGLPVPWLALSLDPSATARSGLALLPGLALFVIGRDLDGFGRRILSLVLLGLCGVSLLLGVAQLSGGPESTLRPYAITNEGSSVGFFANANHFAMMLVCAIPITVAWGVILFEEDRATIRGRLLPIALVLVALLVGIALSKSRAGLLLGFLATLASLGMVLLSLREAPRVRRVRPLLITAASLFMVASAAALLFGLATRTALGDALRVALAAATWHARANFDPVGSGFGTFERVYPLFEREIVPGTYVNHAHNDWLEVWLEGGWAALLLLLAFLGWFGWRCREVWVWRPGSEDARADVLLARASSLAVLFLLMHSLVDYPLRTASHVGVFALACLLLTTPRPVPRKVSDGRPL